MKTKLLVLCAALLLTLHAVSCSGKEMATSVLSFGNSSPQEFTPVGGVDHAAIIDRDPYTYDANYYINGQTPDPTPLVDWYAVTMPTETDRMSKLIVQSVLAEANVSMVGPLCFPEISFYKNGELVATCDMGNYTTLEAFPTVPFGPGWELITWNLTGLNIDGGDALTFVITSADPAFYYRVFALRLWGTYTVEKQIQQSSCTEKTIPVTLCTAKTLSTTPYTPKAVTSASWTGKTIGASTWTAKTIVTEAQSTKKIVLASGTPKTISGVSCTEKVITQTP